MSFHEVRFPTAISRGALVGPERKTDIVTLGSGFEERNSRWANSRRVYNAGYGIKTLTELYNVVEFFEERRGRLYGFRWKDPLDFKSSAPIDPISNLDQTIGTGDGIQVTFQLQKIYGANFSPWTREIKKPVSGTVIISVDGIGKTETVDFSMDFTTGLVTFLSGQVPGAGAVITAGFEFDVPVRFDSDRLEINLPGFQGGAIPSIPLVEVLL